jgi:hypothetical protein
MKLPCIHGEDSSKFLVGDDSLAKAFLGGKLITSISQEHRRTLEVKSSLYTGLIAIVLGFFLMLPLAHIFDAKNWAVFNTWGLAHGSFIFAWPMLAYLNFYLLRTLIPSLRGRQ